MNESDRAPLPHRLCIHISSKKILMIDDDRELALGDLRSAGDDNYWCLHTATDNGPDGGWVRYERCSPQRACYEGAPDSKSPTYRALLQSQGLPSPDWTSHD